DRICRTARRIGDDHAHGSVGVALCPRTRCERPRSRATEQRGELASFHCPMPPVPSTERIAHLGTGRLLHPSSRRNEMIAITPPKIFSKEVAQNRPPHFLARTSLSTRNRFTANFQGWGLNQSSNFARPPHRGAGPHIQLRDQHKNGQ